ncbi:hypothetical protein CVT26_004187 [Gymnopilus dilepis]|uniref:CxC5 like cysteine cluster associated with KDZ domain-containing protein n=1 Tax=Gymnopilus dilepis TaxID=231916 RepID=A0A409WN31_9AGAR|nr:hypothetical protein CVT26_004187 [Gymnopilus dilepis]
MFSPKVSLAFSTLQSVINVQATISDYLDFEGCLKYIELVQILKPTIALSLSPSESTARPPRIDQLTVDVNEFLALATGITYDAAKLVWQALSPIAWSLPDLDPTTSQFSTRENIQSFLEYGISRGLAFYHFLPPTRFCIDPCCTKKRKLGETDTLKRRELAEPSQVKVTVYTRDHGPIPGISTSLYCRNCHTRYYSDYYVNSQESTRTYYVRNDSHFLHVAESVFIETRTLDLFTSMMLSAWTSVSNCARIYNDSIATALCPTPELNIEETWNGLLLYWLLQDLAEEGEILQLVHHAPSQAKRLQPALQARNLRMVGPGQEAWNHICDLCCWIYELPDGTKVYILSVITDGVTIGRPTCMVQDCDVPLESVKDRYCPVHQDEDRVCVVTTCSDLAEAGHRTCTIKSHRSLEEYNSEHNKAMFQLKHRLARLSTSQPSDSIPTAEADTPFSDEEVVVEQPEQPDPQCDGKSEEGNLKLRARFGRRRTHNEELCVASCGVILGRATFYGSEAPNGVRMFWKKLFPTRRSLPNVLWHDNNCRIAAMLQKDNDTYFSNCALPVDVFHFKCKHKINDDHCNANCNPYLWEDLRTPEGKWRFSSSAAEQANAWIGGYQAIVREMQADRYEFFLDEMIKRRNRNIILGLRKKGKEPRSIPREYLLRPDSPECLA